MKGEFVLTVILLVAAALVCLWAFADTTVEPDSILAEDQGVEPNGVELGLEIRVPEIGTAQLSLSGDDDSSRRGTDTTGTLTLSDYDGNASCYDRDASSFWAVVDSHLHFRPFGGSAVSTQTALHWLRASGVLFSSMYGIGQRFPISSNCIYYLDEGCTTVPLNPSIRSDMHNGDTYGERHKPDELGLELFPSMAFPDLSDPDSVIPQIQLLDKEFPNAFFFAGESNVIKQAVFSNGQTGVTEDEIDSWSAFMAVLRERDIPLMLHSDLGNDNNNTAYLHLMERIIQDYPQNKICWLHLGLSRELTTFEGA